MRTICFIHLVVIFCILRSTNSNDFFTGPPENINSCKQSDNNEIQATFASLVDFPPQTSTQKSDVSRFTFRFPYSGMSGLIFLTIALLFNQRRKKSREPLSRPEVDDEVWQKHISFNLANSSDAFMLADLEGRIIWINPEASEIYGYSSEEFKLLNFQQLQDPKYNKEHDALLSRIKVQGTSSFESIHLRKDGTSIHVEIHAQYFKHNGREYIQGIIHDISDRIEYRKSLNASKNILRQVLDTIPMRIFWKNSDSVYLGGNKHFANDAGLQNSDELVGKTDFELAWSDSAQRLRTEDRQIIESNTQKLGYEESTGIPGREDRWLRKNKLPLHDSDGNILGVLGLYEDITSQKIAARALQESEERYRRITSAVTDYIYTVQIKNSKSVQTIHSPTCVAVTGYTAEEFAADPYLWINMVHDADRDLVLKHSQDVVFCKNKHPFEHRIWRKDGAMRWVRNITVCHFDETGNVTAYDGLVSDITDQKIAEEAIVQSEQRFRELADNIREVFWVFDWKTQRILYVSQAYEKIWGRSIQDLYENYNDWAESIHPDDRENAVISFRDIVNTGGGENREYRIVKPDEKIRWISDRGFAIYDDKGSVIRIVGVAEDITERKQTLEAIRDNEKSYHGLFNSVSEAIYIQDTDGSFIDVNQGALKMYGYSREEFIGRSPEFLSAPGKNDMQATLEAVSSVFNDGEPRAFEWWGRRKNGEIFPKEIILNRGSYHGKEVIIATARDISERVCAHENERRFNASLIAMTEATTLLSLEQGIEELCRRAVELGREKLSLDRISLWFKEPDGVKIRGTFGTDESGFTRNEHHITFQIHDNPSIQKVLEGKSSLEVVEDDLKSEDQSLNISGWHIYAPLESKENQILGILCADFLLTNRKPEEYLLQVVRMYGQAIGHRVYALKIEQALHASEERYTYFIDHVNDGVWCFEPAKPIPLSLSTTEKIALSYDAVCVECNSAYAAMYGLKREDIIGQRLGNLMPDNETNRVYLQAFFENNYRIDAAESQEITADGHTKWFLNSMFAETVDHKLIRAWGHQADITERKMAEEENRRLQERLTRSEKMEALGRLAGGVAHDLNNILSGIVAYPDLLLMTLPPDSPIIKTIKAIKQSGERAAAVIQDLLTLSRRGVSDISVSNINDVIKKYRSSPEYSVLCKNFPSAKIEYIFDENLFPVLCSEYNIYKIIMNLVSNGLEAMPDGGTLLISTQNHYIDRAVSGFDQVKEGDYVLLNVKDEGTGIDPEDLKRIFEPFYTKKIMGRYSGTGLGMSVVWGIVQDHKGFIDIKSELGKGTNIDIYFPVTSQQILTPLQEVDKQNLYGNHEKILIVDDVREQRDIARTILEKLQYDVTAVASGEEAIAYMKDHEADLLILDMIMDPGIDGCDTYQKIVAYHPGQKAIIVSGFTDTERVELAQKSGAGSYVRKPYTVEKLGLAVRQELDKKKL